MARSRLRAPRGPWLLALLLGLLAAGSPPPAAAYPALFVAKAGGACDAHPSAGFAPNYHGGTGLAAEADGGIAFSITPAAAVGGGDGDGAPPPATSLCPGASYNVSIAFPEPRLALLTASGGAFAGAPDGGCPNRLYLGASSEPTAAWRVRLAAPCDASAPSLTLRVTSAAGSASGYKTASLSLPLDASCRLSACGAIGGAESLAIDGGAAAAGGGAAVAPPRCPPSDLGYQCSVPIGGGGGATVHYSLGGAAPPNECTGDGGDGAPIGDGVAHLALSVAGGGGDGYLALAFAGAPGSMVPAHAVVGRSPGGGGAAAAAGAQPSVDRWFINGYSPGEWCFASGQSRALSRCATLGGRRRWPPPDSLTLSPSLPRAGGWDTYTDGGAWARAAGVSRSPDGRSVLCFSARLAAAAAEPAAAGRRLAQAGASPPVLTSALALNAAWSPAPGGTLVQHAGAGSVALDLATGASAALTRDDSRAVLHGGLMLGAWCLLLPAGVLAARHRGLTRGRRLLGADLWFQMHRGLQLAGGALVLAASAIALRELRAPPGRRADAHRTLGIVVLSLTCAQLVAGLARPAPGARLRRAWRAAHALGGAAALLGAWGNAYLGMLLAHAGSAAAAAPWIAALTLALAAVAAAAVALERRSRAAAATREREMEVSDGEEADATSRSAEYAALTLEQGFSGGKGSWGGGKGLQLARIPNSDGGGARS